MKYVSISTVISLAAIAGCTVLPTGPSVLVLPGTGQSFDQFRGDDAYCRQYASFQVGGVSANDTAVNANVTSAVAGGALGAVAGAAIDGGRGAAIGGGSGLVAGSLLGIQPANDSMYAMQQSYDTAYIQCMYAKGHQVPVSGQFLNTTPYNSNFKSDKNPNPQTTTPPPPPTGQPPAPPTK